MDKLNWAKRAYTVFLLCATTAIAVRAQTFTTLHNFDFNGTDGGNPLAGLVQATDGNFYGTTFGVGLDETCPSLGVGCGTVFKMTPGGALTTLYSFCSRSGCTDGRSPEAELAQATDGNFYGTTAGGGTNTTECGAGGCGTVFEITSSGTLRTLHSFDSTDGSGPGALVQATNGNFYGTTGGGGAHGYGTVFEITPSGTLTTLYSFDSTDGANPTALVQATNGNFYGTTYDGGANTTSGGGPGCGTVFEITPSDTLTTLHSFDGTDGAHPDSGLIQATNGNFYGTTAFGGAYPTCGFGYGCGTVFEITPSRTLTTLYNFCSQSGCTDGAFPYAGLVQATNGNFYGTTYDDGANVYGTVFEITPSGTLTTLHSFDGTGGANPGSALIQATNGNFYGTTYSGGANTTCSGGAGCGTVFSLDVGLGPQAQIANLQNTVKGLVSDGTINSALGQRLLAQLNAALLALDAGHATQAIRQLDGFIGEVRLLVILGRLTPAEGNTLIAAANSIISAIRG